MLMMAVNKLTKFIQLEQQSSWLSLDYLRSFQFY